MQNTPLQHMIQLHVSDALMLLPHNSQGPTTTKDTQADLPSVQQHPFCAVV